MNRNTHSFAKHEGSAAKHLPANRENPIQIKDADVAELVDARDLKSLGPFDPIEDRCKTPARRTRRTAGKPADLQNIKSLYSHFVTRPASRDVHAASFNAEDRGSL